MAASPSWLLSVIVLLLPLLLETQHTCLGADILHRPWKETLEADVVIDGHIRELPSVSTLHCARHCAAVNACLSFGHSTAVSRCWLYSGFLEHTSHGTPSPGTRYFELLQRGCPPAYGQQWGVCYRVVHTPANWTHGRSVCQAQGGRLFAADSATKFRLLTTLPPTFAYWIGGTDVSKEGEWRWWSGRGARDHWDTGEPNDYAAEDCVYLMGVSKLRTRNCSLQYPYVCEFQT